MNVALSRSCIWGLQRRSSADHVRSGVIVAPMTDGWARITTLDMDSPWANWPEEEFGLIASAIHRTVCDHWSSSVGAGRRDFAHGRRSRGKQLSGGVHQAPECDVQRWCPQGEFYPLPCVDRSSRSWPVRHVHRVVTLVFSASYGCLADINQFYAEGGRNQPHVPTRHTHSLHLRFSRVLEQLRPPTARLPCEWTR